MKWIAGLLLICTGLFADMTVIASDGEKLDSKVSSKASRCHYYIFIDENGKVLEILRNPHQNVRGGASSKLLEMLKDKKVSHMMASNFGEKLMKGLESNKIKYTIYQGDISSAIQSLDK